MRGRRGKPVRRRRCSPPPASQSPGSRQPAWPSAPGTWLPPLTSYVASLSQAWHAWALHGRARHPQLRVVFAALAGLAPLHAERLAARVSGADAERALRDPLTYYDTSSYGPAAIAAMAAVVGADALVHGSDRPVVAPPVDVTDPLVLARARNGARLLAPVEVPA